jgi:excisionase family DNA binding protein
MARMVAKPPVSADTRMALPRLLDAREVAALLGVSERTVRRLAQDDVLTRVRIGHRTSRYTRRSVLALIDPTDEQRPGGRRGANATDSTIAADRDAASG